MIYNYDRREAYTFPRPFYLPPQLRSKEPLVPEGTDLAIWTWEEEQDGKTKYYGIVFVGKSDKPLWHYSFKDASARLREIERTISARKLVIERQQQRLKERWEFEHGLKPGDILYSSWGYDQTNVNFYQVIEVKGKDVIVREVARKVVRMEPTAEYVVAVPNKFIGAPMRRRPTGTAGHVSVKLDNSQRAYPWDGKPEYQTAFGFGH